MFLNSGQTCSALTRMLVPADKVDEAAAIAAQVAQNYSVGDPTAATSVLGPLANSNQLKRVAAISNRASRKAHRPYSTAGRPARNPATSSDPPCSPASPRT